MYLYNVSALLDHAMWWLGLGITSKDSNTLNANVHFGELPQGEPQQDLRSLKFVPHNNTTS